MLGITKVTTIHPEDDINVPTKCHCNLLNSCWVDLSLNQISTSLWPYIESQGTNETVRFYPLGTSVQNFVVEISQDN